MHLCQGNRPGIRAKLSQIFQGHPKVAGAHKRLALKTPILPMILTVHHRLTVGFQVVTLDKHIVTAQELALGHGDDAV